jgi:thymidylate synthase ThyX
MIQAQIIADSVSQEGVRITTLSLVYPRFILSEFNTHRMLSRNSASSRAIPTKKLLEEVKTNPAMPVYWGKNQAGMQAAEEVNWSTREEAITQWMCARDAAVARASFLSSLGLHKQIVNRLLEPFMHARTVVTATEWDNFYDLRRHKDAQPEIKALADAMWEAMQASTPKEVAPGDWHVPYFKPDSDDDVFALAHSIARCARVSYNTHEGKETTKEQDWQLAKRLAESGHWSPFEHQATPIAADLHSNNFRGWKQYRELFTDERYRPFD